MGWVCPLLVVEPSLLFVDQWEGFTQASQLQELVVTTYHKLPPSVEDQLWGAVWWNPYMVYSCPLGVLALGFPGWCKPRSAPTCVFPPGHPAWAIKQFEMAATCAGLGDSQVKPSCESRLAAASAGPGSHSGQLLLVWEDLASGEAWAKTSHSYGKAAWVGIYVVWGSASGYLWDRQTELARLMESQIWHQLAGSVGGGFGKRTMPLLTLMPETLVSPSMPLVPFKLLPWCWSSEGVSLRRCHVGFFKRICLELQKFLPPTQSPLDFCSQKLWGLHLPGTGTLGWGPGVMLGLLTTKISLLNFYPPCIGWLTSPFHVCAPPSCLNGCGFFNSVVVRLSVQLNFWWFWVMVVLYFSHNLDVVVWGGEPCLSVPPSWLEVQGCNCNDLQH